MHSAKQRSSSKKFVFMATAFVLTAAIGTAPGIAATKKAPVKKAAARKAATKTKITSSKSVQAEAEPKPAPSPAILLTELGPLTSTPEQVRKALIEKWGFPTWWPAPIGRIITVGENRILRPLFVSRSQSIETFLDSPLTIEQLADRITPPADYVRQSSSSPFEGRQDITFKVGDQVRLTVSLTVTDTTIAEGKYRVEYSVDVQAPPRPDYDIDNPALPAPNFRTLLRVPAGSQTTELFFGVTVRRGLQAPDGTVTRFTTPDYANLYYSAVVQNAPADTGEQFAKNPLPGYISGPYDPPTPDHLILENAAARRLYIINRYGPQTFYISISHQFLPGEIVPN